MELILYTLRSVAYAIVDPAHLTYISNFGNNVLYEK